MAIVAGPFATEKIGARTCRWQEDQAPFLVNGYRGPHVCGSGWCDIGLPIHGNWPCGARWNRIERPPGRARDDVIGVKSPARRAYTLVIVNRGPNDYHVPRHYWRRGDLHFTGTEHLRERNYGDTKPSHSRPVSASSAIRRRSLVARNIRDAQTSRA